MSLALNQRQKNVVEEAGKALISAGFALDDFGETKEGKWFQFIKGDVAIYLEGNDKRGVDINRADLRFTE